MNYYSAGGFNDPEAAHESQIHFHVLRYKNKATKLLKYRAVRVYLLLTLAMLGIYVLKGLAPSELREKDSDGNSLLAEVCLNSQKYSTFQHFTPYTTILQSKELINKFNHGTSIRDVVYPPKGENTLEAIRFKKELSVLQKEMERTLQAQQFTCIPAIALGVPYNVFMDSTGKLYLNLAIEQVVDPDSNGTIMVTSLFESQDESNLHEEQVYATIRVKYVEPNKLVELVGEEFELLDGYCLQTYVKNFAFENH